MLRQRRNVNVTIPESPKMKSLVRELAGQEKLWMNAKALTVSRNGTKTGGGLHAVVRLQV